ncbi:MAG: VOC family protein [Roseitalea porphyridii]|uniref:VOC family protein n=1 Tax=Roseitalea porphyridii TaxID=1852022 RepID=UPI0032EDB1C8
MQSTFDHFLWGASSLDDARAEFEQMTGVSPVIGGSHPGFGTWNALVSLGNGIYFEIIAPDPEQSLDGNLGGHLRHFSAPRLIGLAMRTDQLSDVAKAYAAHGISTRQLDMSRQAPDGQTLHWSVCLPDTAEAAINALRPFFIDWEDTPHPSGTTPKGCSFRALTVSAPEGEAHNTLWADLGMPVEVQSAKKLTLKLEINSPNGVVTLAG